MRLIDVDSLKYSLCAGLCGAYDQCQEWCHTLIVIGMQPIIDAQLVRHGRWIPLDSKTAKCSCCGWWQHANTYHLPDDIAAFSGCYRFCTACGARMDGGAEQ